MVEVSKKIIHFLKQKIGNIICLLLCFNLLISLFVPMVLVAASSLNNSVSIADNDTTDTYREALINDTNGSRYAGRIWSDKSVFTGNISLDNETDGYDGIINNNSDFLHVFSALGSSQAYVGLPPTKTVIVIDNSGSMYSNNKEWNETRIAKTIESTNKAIDKLMRASRYNEISVVLFGDGPNSNDLDDDSNNIYLFHGNDTAVTILPMKHYQVSSNGTPLEYLKAGWKKSDELLTEELNHTDSSGSGWVFVDNKLAGLNNNDKTENQNYSWYNKNKNWDGWNNCGDKKYTAYSNGTTNIQAGVYQGMQELLNTETTFKVAGNVYNCIPALVILTDGEATDALNNWLNPSTDENGYINSRMGFLNDFSYDGTSFIGRNDSRGLKDGDHTNAGWNQFLAVKNNDGSDFKGDLTDETLAKNDEVYYESIFSANLKSGELPSFESYTYISKDGEEFESTRPTGDSLVAMQKLANTYRESEAYFVFTYLLTAAYYKQAVKNAYNVEDDWNIYTVSVDMDNPDEEGFKAGFKNTGDKNEGNSITTNPFMMNPSKYFNKQFLKQKGYLLSESSDINNTFYDDDTVGDKTIEGILLAMKAWDNFSNGTFATWNQTNGITTYRRINGGYNFYSNSIRNKIKTYRKNEYYFNGELGQESYSEKVVHGYDCSPSSSYYGKDFSAGIYPNPSHQAFWRVYNEQKIGEDFFIPTTTADPSIDLTKLSFNYETAAYYAFSSSSSSTDSIEGVFDIVVKDIMQPAFTPIHDNFSDADYLNYTDPIGKYMEVKDVKNLLLFGELYDVKKTDLKYVVNENGEQIEYNTKPSKYDYTRQYYEIDNKGHNEVINGGYKIINESGNYPSNVHFKISDFKIYVDTKTNSGPLENDQELHFAIPALALPLQVVTLTINPDGSIKSYQTNVANKKDSTPLRLFYEVGVSENVLTKNKKDIDTNVISKEYLEKNTKDGILYFNSNYYSNTLYDGYTADTQDGARTKGDAFLSASPSILNRYYIFQKNLKLYTKAYKVENGELKELTEDEAKNFEGHTYYGELSSIAEAQNKLSNGLKEGDVITLETDVVTYENKSQYNGDSYYYIVAEYYMPTNDGKGKMVQYIVSRKGTEFGSGLLDGKLPKGDFLCWYDANGKNSETYNYNETIPSDKQADANWVLATKIGGLRIGDLHQSILLKDENKTGTSTSYYLPIIADDLSTEGSDVIFDIYLGNNGLLTYKLIDNPNTNDIIIFLIIVFTINSILLLVLFIRKKYFKKLKFQY